MINKLRNRFIRIAMLSVAAVMLLLTAILNIANYISTDNDLRDTLTLIYENQGTIPISDRAPTGDVPGAPPDGQTPPDKSQNERNGRFTPETPFSTRYFVLRYDDDGELQEAELDNIASVGEDDTAQYLSAALKNGAGYGKIGDYRFFVAHTGAGRNMAIFLNCYQELRAEKTVLVWSLVADAACILLVFLLVVLLSRKAIDPVVRSAEQQKQFITDASHELKTPITVIATSLKVLEMETGKQKWIDKAQAQTEKLTELVNSMVMLSRMDEEESPLKPEEFDISAAVEDTAGSFSDFALSRGHELSINVEQGISYRGDEYAVRQLVSILLDNAVKYAVDSTPISVELRRARKGVILRAENTCVSPENIEADKLFDRFYRADKSRSESGSGFGIGLSIARGIAEGHKGRISAKINGDRIVFEAELK